LFKEKTKQFDVEALVEFERQRKFYKQMNDGKRPFEAPVAMTMCWAKNGNKPSVAEVEGTF
jgi:hypothetical protein